MKKIITIVTIVTLFESYIPSNAGVVNWVLRKILKDEIPRSTKSYGLSKKGKLIRLIERAGLKSKEGRLINEDLGLLPKTLTEKVIPKIDYSKLYLKIFAKSLKDIRNLEEKEIIILGNK
ncbi:MAG: hypothetical protein ABGX27_01715 [Desulfurobacteriaceae bacterium]